MKKEKTNKVMRWAAALILLCIGTDVYSQSISYRLKGHIKNWPQTQKVYLQYFKNGLAISDSTIAQQGKFEFRGTLDEPVAVNVYTPAVGPHRRDNYQLFLGEGTTLLQHSDSLRAASLEGPEVALEYRRFEEEVTPIRMERVELMLQAQKLRNEKDSEQYKAIEKQYADKLAELLQAYHSFIEEHPASPVSLKLINELAGTSHSDTALYAQFKRLDPQLLNSPSGRDIGEKFERGTRTSVGQKLANFTAPDTTGNPLSLEEITKNSKLTLVEFWASWCSPCRAENPNLVKLYDEYHDQGFDIIAVSLDRSAASWKNAIAKDGLPWHHVSNLQYWKDPIAQQFNINAVPDSFLLDSNGIIVARGARGQQLRDLVKQLIDTQI